MRAAFGYLEITLFLAVLFLGGCTTQHYQSHIDNVVRVLWHHGHSYGVFVRHPDTNQLEPIEFPTYQCEQSKPPNQVFVVTEDADPNRSMWVDYAWNDNAWSGICVHKLHIHIHSEKDIEGGAWNRGKFGRGQTIVIE